ncbi:metal-sensitive transcriptional repressor family protein [Lipingzhangella sp. LS1_29]|uniref:Metal-sensitive transcriptional repressor family protein n=1 Tax=Lipingzhangella rawalii TaxID=2055835 RepID=A0ABU2H2Q3_9ACTN|nr:metal-sensitive transcriptional repressor family protein [Lipingzhangella rawalii]MDS1269576.1 metal-sensitive transcriptional repressor family protein [Lipingzhangella rawalii]
METTTNHRAARLEQRLAVPVVLAALVSVPSMLLTMWGSGNLAAIGAVGNWISGVVLWAEWILLILLAEDKLSWIRDHKWTLTVAVVTVPAVVLALGPIQVLRVILMVSGLRVLRVTRIVEAGGVLQRRLRLSSVWRWVTYGLVTLVASLYVLVVLADPDSESRRLLREALDRWGPWPLVTACMLIAGGTVVAVLYYRSRPEPSGDSES